MGVSPPFLFRCPVTGLNVQGMGHIRDPEPDDRPRITAVTCLACGGVHLIDPLTGLPAIDPSSGARRRER